MDRGLKRIAIAVRGLAQLVIGPDHDVLARGAAVFVARDFGGHGTKQNVVLRVPLAAAAQGGLDPDQTVLIPRDAVAPVARRR